MVNIRHRDEIVLASLFSGIFGLGDQKGEGKAIALHHIFQHPILEEDNSPYPQCIHFKISDSLRETHSIVKAMAPRKEKSEKGTADQGILDSHPFFIDSKSNLIGSAMIVNYLSKDFVTHKR